MMISLKNNKVVTVDINSNCIRMIQVTHNHISDWASIPLDSGLVQDGVVVDPAIIGNKIKNLMQCSGLRAGKVIISVSGLYSLSKTIELNSTKGNKIEQLVMDEALKEWDQLISQHYIKWSKPVKKRDLIQTFVMAIPKNVIDSLVNVFDSIKIKPHYMSVKGAALSKLVNKDNFLIANMESDCLDIVLTIDRIPCVMHSIKRAAAWSLPEWVNQIIKHINRTVKFRNTGASTNLPRADLPLLLTGYLSNFIEMKDEIEKGTKCLLITPDVPYKYPSGFPVSEYGVNIGLAIGMN